MLQVFTTAKTLRSADPVVNVEEVCVRFVESLFCCKTIMPVSALAIDSSNRPVTQNAPEEKKKLKPCCACPETKKARDACIVENGEENCKNLIEAHKECMRKMGFNI